MEDTKYFGWHWISALIIGIFGLHACQAHADSDNGAIAAAQAEASAMHSMMPDNEDDDD